MVLFDKQTAPKELINSPHYHSHSSDAIFFPQFSSPASQPVSVCAPSLTQPLPTSHASHFTLLCRRLHISTPHPHHRQHLHLSLAPPSPLRKSSPSSAFFFSSAVRPTISGVSLIRRDKCVSLFSPFFSKPPPEKREQGVKVSKRILSSHNRRHYFHIRRCIIHKTNNEGRWWWWWEDVSLRKTPYLGEWISLQSCSVHVCATYAVSNESTPPHCTKCSTLMAKSTCATIMFAFLPSIPDYKYMYIQQNLPNFNQTQSCAGVIVCVIMIWRRLQQLGFEI